jgi:hypothetical protein
MLRPKKGVGERPSSNNTKNIAKGPLLFAVALIAASPVCMAEAAFATSLPSQQAQGSSFQKPSSAYERLAQLQSRSGLSSQIQSQPKTNPSLPLLASSVPSLEDINKLKSTLSNLESQLKGLKNSNIRPERISQLETRIQDLKDTISLAEDARREYLKAQETLSKLLAAQKATEERYKSILENKTNVESTLQAKQLTLQEQEAIKTSAQNTLDSAQVALSTAQTNANNADAAMTAQNRIKTAAEVSLLTSQEQYSTAAANLDAAQQTFNEASSELEAAGTQLEAANQALVTAQQNLEVAQDNYDNNLIPDPDWTAPTYQKENIRTVENTRTVEVRTQVPTTTMIATGGVLAEVFNRNGYNNAPPMPYSGETPIYSTTVSTIDFNWGSGQVLDSGRSEDVIVRFTGNLLVPTDGWYQFYTPADDGTRLNIAGMEVIDDWFDKGGGGSISDPVWIRAGIFYPFTLHYYENGGGASVGFYTYSPQQGFNLVPTTWIGRSAEQQTTYEEVITYEEETYYTYETYYTTELVTTEGTINVDIGEGGQATFTAPAGAVFISANLRYESYNDPSCGADVSQALQAGVTSTLSQITLSADNSIWGDPCGGQVKHLVGTLTYLGQPTAPLIKDPALLPAVQQAQETYDVAWDVWNSTQNLYEAKVSTRDSASSDLDDYRTTFNEAEASKSSAQSQLNVETAELARLTTLNEEAQTKLVEATQVEATASQQKVEAVTKVEATSLEVSAATEELATTTEEAVATEVSLNAATLKVAEAQKVNDDRTKTLVTTYETAVTKTEVVTEDVKTAPTDLIPEPPVEEGSKEIPAVLTAENLMDVNLEAVDPTELTEAQAEQLVAAAMETFETAEQGSEEYEQALDALYLAAEQDDIVLDPALAAIPGLAAATELVNFFGNAGADMSPKVREESEKIVVTAVVAAGAAIQSAAAAASTASAPSGGSRRIGK